MKKIKILTLLSLFFIACGGNSNDENTTSVDDLANNTEAAAPAASAEANPDYDPNRGIGKFDKVEVGATVDQALATKGESVYDVKCSSCHKLTDEKLVGPGWKGVTSRRTAEWLMNFATNPDAMIDKDPELQAQLEICLVRMPNQNISDDDARNVYEFMRKNDGVK